MQHFDIASIASRSIIIPSAQVLPIALGIEGWDVIDTSSDEIALPVSQFSLLIEETFLPMSRKEHHAHFKGASKARTISRKQARAAKRSQRFA